MSKLLQGTDAWHEMRQSKIGSSDASAIMGLNPYGMTARRLWEQKKGLIPEQRMNSAMERGKRLEGPALEWFQNETNLIMFPTVVFHAEYPDLMASLDGATMELDQVVEIKTGGTKMREMAIKGQIPDHYKCQLQHQMLVTDLDYVWFCFYDEREEFNGLGMVTEKSGCYFKVERDQDFIDRLFLKELEFLQYLKGDIPPPAGEDDHIKVEADDEQIATITKWIEISAEKRKLDEYEKMYKEQITSFSDDGNTILCDHFGNALVKLTRVNREGAVDYDKLFSDLGISEDTVNKYRKPQIGYWSLKKA